MRRARWKSEERSQPDIRHFKPPFQHTLPGSNYQQREAHTHTYTHLHTRSHDLLVDCKPKTPEAFVSCIEFELIFCYYFSGLVQNSPLYFRGQTCCVWQIRKGKVITPGIHTASSLVVLKVDLIKHHNTQQ